MLQTVPIRCNSRGFTLVEIMVVLVILAVVMTMVAGMSRGLSAAAMRSTTTSHLANVDAALVAFATVNRRLPCPADGAIPSANPGAGAESVVGGVCALSQARGVVPWTTLGITESDASDGYSVRLTYRVAPDLVVASAVNFTDCDNSGGSVTAAPTPSRCAACASGAAGVPASCTQSTAAFTNRGLEVRTAAGAKVADPAMNLGAAYVLLSHGENRGGGYGQGTGSPQEVTTPMGTGEAQNSAGSALQAFYVSDSFMDSPNHFDDVVSSPTLINFAQKAGLGPRVHLPG